MISGVSIKRVLRNDRSPSTTLHCSLSEGMFVWTYTATSTNPAAQLIASDDEHLVDRRAVLGEEGDSKII